MFFSLWCGVALAARASGTDQMVAAKDPHLRSLLSDAHAQCTEVSVAVDHKSTSLHTIGALEMMKDTCRHVASVMRGTFKSRAGATIGPLQISVDVLLAELDRSGEIIDAFENALANQIKTNLNIAKLARGIDESVNTLDELFDICMEDSDSQVSFNSCIDLLEDARQSLRQQVDALKQTQQGQVVILDASAVETSLKSLVEMLGVSAVKEKAEADQVQKALKEHQDACDKYFPALKAWENSKGVLQIKETENAALFAMHTAEFEVLDRLVANAAKRVGDTGLFHRSGSPCNDKTRWIDQMWDQDGWDELIAKYGPQPHVEECGFKYWYDATPTPEQEAARAQWEERVAEKDAKKKEWDPRLEASKAALQAAIADEKIASANKVSTERIWENSKPNLEAGLLQFSIKNPVEYSQLKLLLKMKEMLAFATKHQGQDETHVKLVSAFAAGIQRNLETVMAENKDLATTKKEFKKFSGKLKSAVSDPCSAPVGLLRRVPEVRLQMVLQPLVSFASNQNAISEVDKYVASIDLSFALDSKPAHDEL